MNFPTIAKVSRTLPGALQKIGYRSLTADDQFLVRLNKVFSKNADPYGLRNQPRGYNFDQRVPFEILPAPALLDNRSLEDVVDRRAIELVALDKPLNLFWSGGIDSTLMTAAILPKTKNVTVYHTCESIKENPYFIDYINKFNIKTVIWSDAWVNKFNHDDVIVTGTSADEITGSLDKSFWDACNDKLTDPWQDFFTQHGYTDLIPRCEQLFAQSPTDITTLFDARWWFYFYIRHTYFARRDWDLNLHNDFGNVVSFFDCAEFDSWSLHNKSELIGTKYSDYKRIFKEATKVYWINQDYVDNKEKTNSHMMSSWLDRRVIWDNHQYLFIYKHEDGYRKFVPEQYPYISKTAILKALKDV